MSDPLERRCGTCARFVRVIEKVDASGQVRNAGECLLGVWPAPLYETGTCSQWVQRGQFQVRPPARAPRERSPTSSPRSLPTPIELPEDVLEMDADEFRKILSQVIREELGVKPIELGAKWAGGEVVLKPGKDGLQEKRVPIDVFFHKIVMLRDRLRVLEQRINGNPKLAAEEKVQMQQYITACYGSLTTFNVLFADRDDQFVGQKGEE
jgi:hypothetical protein